MRVNLLRGHDTSLVITPGHPGSVAIIYSILGERMSIVVSSLARASAKKCLFVIVAATGLAACAEAPVAPVVVDQDEGPSTISIVQTFEAKLQDPESAGRKHNAELDSLLDAVKEKRAKLGRRLFASDFCDVITTRERSARRGQGGAANRASRSNWRNNNRLSDLRFVDECPDDSPTRVTDLGIDGPQATGGTFVPVTWVDSIFDTEWLESEFDLPTPQDDIDLMATMETSVMNAIALSTSHSDLTLRVNTVMTQLGSAGPEEAEVVAEVGAFTVESSEYWDENYEDWEDQFCDDLYGDEGGGPLDSPSAVSSEERCEIDEGGGGPLSTASGDPDLWERAIDFVGSDVEGFVSVGAGVVGLYRDLTNRWEKEGRKLGRALDSFREEIEDQVEDFVDDPKRRRKVIRRAGKFLRSGTFQGLAIGAAIDSAVGAVLD